MERRSFILGLFALSGGAAAAVIGGQAVAAPVLNGAEPILGAVPTREAAATLLDGTPIEQAQYRRRPRRSRQVCTIRRNRFGRRVRVCRTVWY
jgi:hypothetical protein